jgi:hypothetical protein
MVARLTVAVPLADEIEMPVPSATLLTLLENAANSVLDIKPAVTFAADASGIFSL